MNTAGGLKLQSIRFMENFEPDPKVSAVAAWEVVRLQHPILANILFLMGTNDLRLPGKAYVINQEFFSRGDNSARYEDIDLSCIDHSWNGDPTFSNTRVLILSDSCNLADMP